MSPYRARAARARALFCAGLQEGEFPSAAPPDPLLAEERRARARQSRPAPRRPGRRGALPLPRLRLAPDRAPLPELAELRRGRRRARPLAVRRRGPRPGRAGRRGGGAADPRPRPRARRDRRRGGDRRRGCWPGRWPATRAPAERPETLERLGVERRRRRREPSTLFAGLPDPERAAGAAALTARCSSRLGERAHVQRQLARGLGALLRTGGSSTTSSRRSVLDPTADPLWLGGVVHAALERLYAEPPGDDSIPRPGDLGRWQRRFGELLDELVGDAGRARPGRAERRSSAPAPRSRPSSPTRRDRDRVPPRPRAARARLRRARPRARGRAAPRPRAASSASSSCAAGSTASTSRPTGAARSSATTRPASRSPRPTSSATAGTLQIQLYMLVARRVLGLDPVAGLYQPLGAPAPRDRRAAG